MRGLALLLCVFLVGALQVRATALVPNDEAALKFALALKRAQLGVFEAGMANITMQDFLNAGYNVTVYQYLALIEAQLQQQAANLSALLAAGGAAPLPECTYSNESAADPEAFLLASRDLCNVAASGVAALVPLVADAEALALLASGHSVAGRHCAYLNLVGGLLPFPAAHENATSLAATQAALAPYIESCPYTLALPNPRRATSAAAHLAVAAALLLLPALQLFAF